MFNSIRNTGKSLSIFGVLFLLSLTGLYAQNVGIGTENPKATLSIKHVFSDSLIFQEDMEDIILDERLENLGDMEWTINQDDAYDGKYGLTVVNPQNERTAHLQLQVAGPSDKEIRLTFHARHKIWDDIFQVLIDGIVEVVETDSSDWQEYIYILPPGDHIIDWMYVKNSNVNPITEDSIFIDLIEISYKKSYGIMLEDGTQADGKVLVSDPFGNGSWERLIIRQLFDLDDDTGIHTEQNPDNDVISLFAASQELWRTQVVTNTGSYLIPRLGSNIVIGNQSANVLNGASNVFFGHEIASFATNSVSNSIIGNKAGKSLTTGSYNSMLGEESGINLTSGSNNTLLGYRAGGELHGFSHNTFIGSLAGALISTGGNNTMIGYNAGGGGLLGSENVFLGDHAGMNNNTSYNTFVGSRSGYQNTNGTSNSFFGRFSGGSNTSGTRNTFIGDLSGSNSTIGHSNTLIGASVGLSLESGSHNVMVGDYAGYSSILGEDNVFVGRASGIGNMGSRNTLIGTNANQLGFNGNRNVLLGCDVATEIEGDDNVVIGETAGNVGVYQNKVLILGARSGKNNEAEGSVFLGYEAGLSHTVGTNNVYVGRAAGRFSETGSHNTFVGNFSGYTNATGSNNSFIGFNTGNLNNNGNNNTFLGNEAGKNNVSGDENTFIGAGAGFHNTADFNTFLGEAAGYNNTTGYKNTFLGENAGALTTTGYQNVMVGSEAGELTTTGYYNTFMGELAGHPNTTGHNNVAIGRNTMIHNNNNTFCTLIGVNASLTSYSNSFYNSSVIGYNGILNANNRIRMGNTNIFQIGGYASWTDLSDQRTKRNISEDKVPGLDFIMDLRPVSYTIDYDYVANHIGEYQDLEMESKDKSTFHKMQKDREEKSKIRRTGLLAQEVAALVEQGDLDFSGVQHPENENDLYGLNYAEFTAPLIKAMQEMYKKVEELEQTIALQEKEIQRLKNKE